MKKLKYLLWLIPILLFSCTKEESPLPEEEESPFNFISKIEVDLFVDDVTYQVYYKDTLEDDQVDNSELSVEFTTVAGSSYFDPDVLTYYTSFDNPRVLGKLVRGEMEVVFTEDNRDILLIVEQTREFESLLFGSVTQTFRLGNNAVPLDNSYLDDSSGQIIHEYMVTGYRVCNPAIGGIDFNEDNDIYYKQMTTKNCTGSAYLHVRVYVKAD